MRNVTEFSVGDILRTSFSLYFGNLPTFLPLSLIVFLPSFAVVLLLDSSTVNSPVQFDPRVDDPRTSDLAGFFVVGMRESIVELICSVWLQAGLAFGVVRHLRGGEPGFVETFYQSVRMLLPAALVALIVAIATALGLFLLIVPGIIIALVLWVAVPAAVVERSGVRALGRSAELTNGYKGQIFGLALILFVFRLAVTSVVLALWGIVTTDPVLSYLVLGFCVVVTSGIWATATSVTYHDLRVLREGVDTQVVARVFE